MSGRELGAVFEGKTLLGRYHLKRLLAEGNFGAVFHGEHRVLGKTVRDVAVKITARTNLNSTNIHDTFGEAIVSARVYDRLEGSSVTRYLVPVYDVGILSDHDGRGFVVLGLVRGVGSTPEHCVSPKTLAETIRNWSETGTAAAMEYMRRICEAVGALHDQNVIHRDLKPDNILLSERGQIRLVDLGLAADLDAIGQAYGSVGTLSYMAPETGLEGRSSRASDVYSLGIIVYELLTGRHPFKNLHPPLKLPKEQQAMWLQREKAGAPIVPPSAYGCQVEQWQDGLVLRCLSSMDTARPQSASELRRLIELRGNDPTSPFSGGGWADWFSEERNWSAEVDVLEKLLGKWQKKHRDGVWFEAVTKLAICRLSTAGSDLGDIERLLRSAEELVRRGDVITTYSDRARWYGGLADVMEQRGRAGLLKANFREEEIEARRRSLLKNRST